MGDAGAGSQETVQAAWRRALETATPVLPARDLYAGRAFGLARDAADSYGADLSVVSAGLGWVTGATRIPAYDATLTGGNLRSAVGGKLDPRAWWDSVVHGPFSTPPADDVADRPLVLACVTQAYAPFFAAALMAVSRDRLRIFGAGLHRRLPEHLASVVMPYDERLDSLVPGTRADFAQRALCHFLFQVSPSDEVDEDKFRVLRALEGLSLSKKHNGHSVSDEDIRSLIVATAATRPSGWTAMLRHFRDVLGVACEQSRFARLFGEVSRR